MRKAKFLEKFLKDQKGFVIPPLLAIAAVGLILFLLLASFTDFKNTLFSQLYPKEQASAAKSSASGTNSFSQLSAVLEADSAKFHFLFSGSASSFMIDVSTSSNMKQNIFRDFGSGTSSPVVVLNPQSKWDKYRCGSNIYWTISSSRPNVKSSIQTARVVCQTPFPTPAATPVPTSTPTPAPTSTPLRTNYYVKPYLVYPSDKPTYPEYEATVKNYLVELQNWYREKVGVTFFIQPLVVVRSSYNYDIMRCDPNPYDSTPPSSECLNDPKRLDGNWGMYMNLAIHNGVEKWDEQTATLVFSAGGGGYAGANKYPNDAGWAISGDWVLEPISSVANSWGIPCKYSDGWQCSGGVPKGTPAHELGHAFGLGHPDPILYPDPSIMKWHGDYPTVGFLPHEVDYLKQSPFFK